MTTTSITTTTTKINITLCIPRVFSNINEERIRAIFRKLSLGNICRIDFVSIINAKGEKYNRVFIHFDEWFKNINADTSLARLHEGKEIKIIYDEPWFWKVTLYRKKETTSRPNPRPNPRPSPRIEYDNNIRTPPPPPPKQSDVVPLPLPIKPKKMHYRQHSHNNNMNTTTTTTTTSPIQARKLNDDNSLEEGEIEEN